MIAKVLKFGSTWCMPCKELEKRLKDFNTIPIECYDVDDEEELCKEYYITNIPVLIFLDENEREVKRVVGLTTVDDINKLINDYNSKETKLNS